MLVLLHVLDFQEDRLRRDSLLDVLRLMSTPPPQETPATTTHDPEAGQARVDFLALPLVASQELPLEVSPGLLQGQDIKEVSPIDKVSQALHLVDTPLVSKGTRLQLSLEVLVLLLPLGSKVTPLVPIKEDSRLQQPDQVVSQVNRVDTLDLLALLHALDILDLKLVKPLVDTPLDPLDHRVDFPAQLLVQEDIPAVVPKVVFLVLLLVVSHLQLQLLEAILVPLKDTPLDLLAHLPDQAFLVPQLPDLRDIQDLKEDFPALLQDQATPE